MTGAIRRPFGGSDLQMNRPAAGSFWMSSSVPRVTGCFGRETVSGRAGLAPERHARMADIRLPLRDYRWMPPTRVRM